MRLSAPNTGSKSFAALLKRHRPVENDVERRALPQVDLLAPAQQHRRQSDSAADTSADTSALPAPVGDASDRSAAARQDGDLLGILAASRALLDGILVRIHSLAGVVRIHRAQVGR